MQEREKEGCWFMTKGHVYYQEPNRVASQICIYTVQVCIHSVCNRGGEGIRLCGKHIQELYLHCVFDQIPYLQNWFYTPNKNLGGGLRQINTCRPVPIYYRSIFKKRGHLGFGVFLDIWSMLTIEHSGVAQLIVHQLDVRQALVLFLARHPREVFPAEWLEYCSFLAKIIHRFL